MGTKVIAKNRVTRRAVGAALAALTFAAAPGAPAASSYYFHTLNQTRSGGPADNNFLNLGSSTIEDLIEVKSYSVTTGVLDDGANGFVGVNGPSMPPINAGRLQTTIQIDQAAVEAYFASSSETITSVDLQLEISSVFDTSTLWTNPNTFGIFPGKGGEPGPPASTGPLPLDFFDIASSDENTTYTLQDVPLEILTSGIFLSSLQGDHTGSAGASGRGFNIHHTSPGLLGGGRFGFTVYTVPEPSSVLLVSLAACGVVMMRRCPCRRG